METFESLPETNLSESISSPEDSPVSMFQTPAAVPEFPPHVRDFIGRQFAPFAWYDRKRCCWRTWQLCLTGEWEPFSGTWPRRGLMRNGIAYRPLILERRPCEIACSRLPTPQSIDWKGTSEALSHKFRRTGHLKHWTHGTPLALHSESGRSSWPNPELSEFLVGLPHGWTDLSGG